MPQSDSGTVAFMVVWAHSRSDITGHRHPLAEHCESTAQWAKRFAEPFGGGDLAYALGLFHDAGKASCAWQERLLEVEGTGQAVGVPHKNFGAHLVSPIASAAAMAVQGHHGGLTSLQDLKNLVQTAPTTEDLDTRNRFLETVPEAAELLTGENLIPPGWLQDKSAMEMRLRLVFSALVDADHLDTGAHKRGLPGPQVAPPADMPALAERFEQRRKTALRETNPDIDALRAEVYDAAVRASSIEPGIFRLTAPTGLGKTYAQGAFGLHHAARWGKARVIVAVPFITITEQNAKVYRRLLDDPGDPVVLEHHSSIRIDRGDDSPVTAAERWARLAAENWDAPFVVTTTVQLFDSLFGRKPSQVRKLHRLANAVLILDEVQALPARLLLPILDGLRILTEHFGTTVLLTSATQPEFQALSTWRNPTHGQAVTPTEIIPNPQSLFDRARRVHYQWRLNPKPTWEQVAHEISGLQQALVIVNSTSDARRLYRLLRETRPEHVWHLSTRLCPEHRHHTLEHITARLNRGEPTLVVSTQLIEAGVDLSFPVVWRALAPADSLQQAGGRANRNGELDEDGLVVVFEPADGLRPSDYDNGCNLTEIHFGAGEPKLDNQDALGRYYTELYQALRLDHRPIDRTKRTVGQTIQDNRSKLDYVAVADGPIDGEAPATKRNRKKAFRMIIEDTVPLVVTDESQHAQRIDAILANLAAGTATTQDLRRLQPWIVQLPAYLTRKPEVAALIDPIIGDLGRWKGTYDWDPHTYQGHGLTEVDFASVF